MAGHLMKHMFDPGFVGPQNTHMLGAKKATKNSHPL